MNEVIQLITSLVTLVGVVLALIGTRQNKGRIEDVHKEVNSTAETQVKRVEQLSQALQDSDIPIPSSPSEKAVGKDG